MIRPAPGIPIHEQPELALVRMLLWGEARGEGPRGMAAIRFVLDNRAKRWGWTLKRVILQPWHFSSFNEGDPNRTKMLGAWSDDPLRWGQVDAVCSLYDGGMLVNQVGDADHYYAYHVVTPKWGRGHPQWQERSVIGNHVFGVAG